MCSLELERSLSRKSSYSEIKCRVNYSASSELPTHARGPETRPDQP